MKLSRFPFRRPILSLLPLLVVFALYGCATGPGGSSSASAARPAQLQVQVITPTMAGMDPMWIDDVEDAFSERLATALHEQGFHGHINLLYDTDRPAPGIPLLRATLEEWRVDPVGNVTCTFTAQLKTAQGERSLGLFTGDSVMMWPEHDWFARADQFRSAASDAMTDLWKRMRKTGLMGDVGMMPAR